MCVQVAPYIVDKLYSSALSPFCRHPVSVRVFLWVAFVVLCAVASPTTVANIITAINPAAILPFIVFSSVWLRQQTSYKIDRVSLGEQWSQNISRFAGAQHPCNCASAG